MNELLMFFAGAALCNCIPHLGSGLRGEPFPTPFAKPRGVGDSPPLVNFLWGAANLFVGCFIVWRQLTTIPVNPGLLPLVLGFVAIGVYLSLHFATARGRR